MTVSQYVFGYGSLICARSRAITVPGKVATPVVVRGLERTWTACFPGMTVMGVRFAEKGECVGVVIPVTDEDLEFFDERELGYDRLLLEPEDVSKIDYLAEEHYKAEDHQEFFKAKNGTSDSLKIYVYVNRDPSPPSEKSPIPQSYVDTILRGCLSFSEEFATQFIITTKGWHPVEQAELHGDYSDDEVEDKTIWVDDRHTPIYKRGDQSYSLKNALFLDELLETHLPDHFIHRKRLQ